MVTTLFDQHTLVKGSLMTSNPSKQKTWNLVRNMDEVHKTQVFSGGSCNILNADGKLLRNRERDSINDWLTEHGIYFFDPQIHPDTHGVEYDYATHHPLEVAARKVAKINLYEVSPRTFGGITSFEIAADHFRWREPTVLYYSDGDAERDTIPAHSRKGHPIFVPDGMTESESALRAHYREFKKNANNMRKYLMHFAREMDTLTVAFGDHIRESDVVISPERMHAADLFRAIVMALKGEQVMVAITGGREARDETGNPVIIMPTDPPEMELRALLDQYVDEGNQLRREIVELVDISVFTRVVYTQKSAILALEEVLRIRELID